MCFFFSNRAVGVTVVKRSSERLMRRTVVKKKHPLESTESAIVI